MNRADAWIAVLLFASSMVAFWLVGLRLGRRMPQDAANDPESRLADAALALLGLLLAFTFAMSLERHDRRRDRVLEESNAIGDFYTCATLLADPQRTALQDVIRAYAQNELDYVRRYVPELEEQQQAVARSHQSHARMTDLVAQAVGNGTPIAINLTNTLNAVTSAHASRLAAYEDRLPWNTELLLLVCAGVASFLMGRQQGATQRIRLTATFSFIALVSLVILVILDLNQPHRGFIKVNVDVFDRLVQSLQK
jgi:hypothetical protein